MKKICVLLAAYNGEKWIEKQISTILNQKKVKIDLFISDDGSDDDTFEKIKKVSTKKKNILIQENLNLVESFYSKSDDQFMYKLIFKSRNDLNSFLDKIADNENTITYKTSSIVN